MNGRTISDPKGATGRIMPPAGGAICCSDLAKTLRVNPRCWCVLSTDRVLFSVDSDGL